MIFPGLERVAIDLETTKILDGKFPRVKKIHMVSYAYADVVGHIHLDWTVGEDYSSTISFKRLQELLDRGLAVFHGGKFDIALLRFMGLRVSKYIDTMIMGYVLNPNIEPIKFEKGRPEQHSLRAWAHRCGSYKAKPPISWEEYTPQMGFYGEQDAVATLAVCKRMEEWLEAGGLEDFFLTVEYPFMECIMEMEQTGMHLDVDELYRLDREMSQKETEVLAELQKIFPRAPGKTVNAFTQDKDNEPDSYFFVGTKTVKDTRKNGNPNGERTQFVYREWTDYTGTPSQIVWGLQQLYGWVPLEFTEGGDVKVDKTVLGSLRSQFPVVEKILEHRQLAKFTSTYTSPYIEFISEEGKIHANWNQAVTKTGRLSSSAPNFQNVPAHSDLGKQIRKIFTPSRPGRCLLVADLQGIEYRVLAALQWQGFMDAYGYIPEDVQYLVDVFLNEEDVHTQMAILWGILTEYDAFCLTGSNLCEEADIARAQAGRSKSKNISYGNMFGFGAEKLAMMAGISFQEAEALLMDARGKNPSLMRFKRMVWDEYRQNNGISYTLFGRRLIYPMLMIDPRQRGFQRIWDKWDVSPRDARGWRAAAERESFNAKVQGTAADLFKILIMACREAFRGYEMVEAKLSSFTPSSLVAQIHDEVIFEVDEDKAEDYKNMMNAIMNREDLLPGGVPIRADAHTGKSWGEAKK